jgi:hypothetical protein
VTADLPRCERRHSPGRRGCRHPRAVGGAAVVVARRGKFAGDIAVEPARMQVHMTDEAIYHDTIVNIVKQFDYPRTELSALGLYAFLEGFDFEAGPLNTVTNSASGSRMEEAILIATLFPELNHHAEWWRNRYLDHDFSFAELHRSCISWRDRFSNVPYLKFLN